MKTNISNHKMKFITALHTSLEYIELPEGEIVKIIRGVSTCDKLSTMRVTRIADLILDRHVAKVEQSSFLTSKHTAGYMIGHIIHNYINLVRWYAPHKRYAKDDRYATGFGIGVEKACELLLRGDKAEWSLDVVNEIEKVLMSVDYSGNIIVT